MATGRTWNGSGEDWLHGDEPYGFDLPDADDYPPMEQWEIDEAKAEILADEACTDIIASADDDDNEWIEELLGV